MTPSNESALSEHRLFPSVSPLNVQAVAALNERKRSVLGLYSRECSAELLARLTGSNCFVERPLAPEVIEAAELGHDLLYVTAPELPDHDTVIDYYVRLKPRTLNEVERIKQNFFLLTLNNSEPLWLSQKLIAQEAKQARNFIAEWVSEKHQRGQQVELHTFEPSVMTEVFARELNLVPDQAPSETIAIGSKFGSRQIFKACGLDRPCGTTECHSFEHFAQEVARILQQEPEAKKLIFKLSSTLYGAGQGNSLFNAASINRSDDLKVMLQQVLANLVEENVEVVDRKLGWQGFLDEIPKAGVIAEVYIEGNYKETPSAQGIVDRDGSIRLTSIHEQRLASNKQTYIGSFYPANSTYRNQVGEMFKLIASQANAQGHTGPIAVDFLCVRNSLDADWRILPIEINNRLTGTAHSFRIVTSLLGTQVTENSPELWVNGETRVYLASDSIYKPEYAVLRPSQVIDAVRASNIHYNDEQKRGVVLYMLSGLVYGKCGAVVIGTSEDECKSVQDAIYQILDELVIVSGRK